MESARVDCERRTRFPFGRFERDTPLEPALEAPQKRRMAPDQRCARLVGERSLVLLLLDGV